MFYRTAFVEISLQKTSMVEPFFCRVFIEGHDGGRFTRNFLYIFRTPIESYFWLIYLKTYVHLYQGVLHFLWIRWRTFRYKKFRIGPWIMFVERIALIDYLEKLLTFL